MKNYLKSIRGEGLKSGDFEHKLERVNLITGLSGSGKTGVVDAIRLALCGKTLLGRDEELKGSKNQILKLSRHGYLRVIATDSRGMQNGQVWPDDSNAGTLGMIGGFPDILLDSNEYFSLAAKPRDAYIVAHYPLSDEQYSREAISAQIKNIRLEENTEATETIIAELVALVMKSKEEAVPARIASLVEMLKKRSSDANAVCKSMTETVRGITALSGDALPLRNPESEIKSRTDELNALLVRQGELAALLKSKSEKEARNKTIKSELEQAGAVDVEAVNGEMTALNDRLTKERSELAAGDSFGPEQPILDRIAEIDVTLAGLALITAEVQNLFKCKSEREQKIALADARIATMRKEYKERFSKLKLDLEKECCPTCGQAIEQRIKKAMQDEFSEFAALSKREAARLEAEKVEHNGYLSRISEGLAAVGKAADEEKKEWKNETDLRIQLEALRKSKKDWLVDHQKNIDKSHHELNRLQTILNSNQATIARRGALETELKQNEEWLSSNCRAEENKSDCDGKIDVLRVTCSALTAKQRAFIQAQSDEVRNVQALVEHAKSKANVDITKLALKKLEAIQSEITTKAFESIVVTINQITRGIIAEPIEYRDGELGRWVGSTWVSNETFSQGQKLLVYAGVSLSLSKDAPIKLVMIDDLGKLDRAAVRALLNTMIDLTQSGIIDQFIGCISVEKSEGVLFGSLDINVIEI